MVPPLRAWAEAAGEAGASSATEDDDLSFAGTRVDAPRRRLPRVDGHSVNLPPAQDLHADGQRSARERIPLLLFFDLWDCPWCDRALREFLVPMATGEEWGARAIYRQIEIDKPQPAVDFSGDTTTHRALAARFRVKVTPTIHLVDARGEPLSEPLLGLMNPDFYAAYLERAITDAAARLKSPAGASR